MELNFGQHFMQRTLLPAFCLLRLTWCCGYFPFGYCIFFLNVGCDDSVFLGQGTPVLALYLHRHYCYGWGNNWGAELMGFYSTITKSSLWGISCLFWVLISPMSTIDRPWQGWEDFKTHHKIISISGFCEYIRTNMVQQRVECRTWNQRYNSVVIT